MPTPDAQRDRAFLKIWWIIWAMILFGLVAIYFVLGRRPLPAAATAGQSLTGLVGLVPLFVSIVIRWLVLPRFGSLQRAFPLYIVGLALAEGCGILGLFLGGAYRDDLFALGVLGVAQYVPVFARKLLEPKPVGFIPNN